MDPVMNYLRHHLTGQPVQQIHLSQFHVHLVEHRSNGGTETSICSHTAALARQIFAGVVRISVRPAVENEEGLAVELSDEVLEVNWELGVKTTFQVELEQTVDVSLAKHRATRQTAVVSEARELLETRDECSNVSVEIVHRSLELFEPNLLTFVSGGVVRGDKITPELRHKFLP